MANPFFSGRIPKELLDHVEQHRESTGETKTDVLVKALAAYTGFQLDEKGEIAPPASITSELLERLEKLEAHVFGNAKAPFTEQIIETYPLLDEIKRAEESNKPDLGNKTQILTTAEAIATVGVSQGALSQWKSKGLLPKEFKGYLIDFSHSEKKPRNSFWKIIPV